MTLHIYNPEHDIALAKNSPYFTPPKAARITHHNFCHVPALWAEDGDWVVVDDVEVAKENLSRMDRKHADVRFVTFKDLACLKAENMPKKVEPWGWDKHLVNRLLRCNALFSCLVPDTYRLESIRRMSSREFVANEILPELVALNTSFIGEMTAFRGTTDELEAICRSMHGCVLKSPWSCSGRGVRFVESELTESEKGWCSNIINEQGVLMIEPIYNKVLDFAMEFVTDEQYQAHYLGLNIFSTNNGAYLGNLDETEENKRNSIGELIPMELLDIVKEKIVELTSSLFNDSYSGPFGVDMMVVKSQTGKLLLHPCVELNLRRTMGHINL